MTLSFSVQQYGFSPERPSIVVVDRYPLTRSCFARVLRGEFQEFTILEMEAVNQFDAIAGRNVSLVIINIGNSSLADECVIQSLSYLRQILPEGPLMLLTRLDEAHISDVMISEVTRFGVKGYLTDAASIEIALAALRLVIAGGVYFPRTPSSDVAWSPVPPEGYPLDVSAPSPETPSIMHRTDIVFTERELQVLAALLRGLSNKVIAGELRLSQNTVKSHISRIMHKLHARNRTEAVVLLQHGSHVANGGDTAP